MRSLSIIKWFILLTNVFNLYKCYDLEHAMGIEVNKGSHHIHQVYLDNIRDNMNTSIDPCKDFYQYACGNWHQNHNSIDYLDAVGYMEHKVNNQFRELLGKLKYTNGIYSLINNASAACNTLENMIVNPMLEYLHSDINCLWPIYAGNETWKNASNFDWLTVVGRLRTYGLNGIFITMHVNVLYNNGSHYVLELQQRPPSVMLDLQDLRRIYESFGYNSTQRNLIITDVMNLEQNLKNISLATTMEQQSDDLAINTTSTHMYELLTVENLINRAPQIDWLKYLQLILINSTDERKQQVQCLAFNENYYKALKQLLDATSNTTIAHYIMLKAIYYLYSNLPEKRPEDCVKYLRGHMPLFMNYIYEKYIFKDRRLSAEKVLKEIFENLREQFYVLIKENHLQLNNQQQMYVLQELLTMRLKLGNTPENCTDRFLEEYYKNMQLDSTDFYANHLSLLKLLYYKNIFKLQNTHFDTASELYVYEMERSASSSPVKLFDNVVLVPLGYVQMPFFDSQIPSHLQYSLFGFILAHEIIHAFDLSHIFYDHEGKYNRMGYLISDHFTNYTNCDGASSFDILSENMADVSGLHLAFPTYNKAVANSSFLVSSLNLTNEQLFFVNSVQFLCADMTKISSMHLDIPGNSHEMHDARIRKNWSQYEEFIQAFNCTKEIRTRAACMAW